MRNISKNALVALPAFVLGIVLAGGLSMAKAGPAQVSSGVRYAYSVIMVPEGALGPVQDNLSNYAKDGWELYAVTSDARKMTMFLQKRVR